MQYNIGASESLAKAFKAACAAKGKSMSEVLEAYMGEYVRLSAPAPLSPPMTAGERHVGRKLAVDPEYLADGGASLLQDHTPASRARLQAVIAACQAERAQERAARQAAEVAELEARLAALRG